jgi:hypothetical protein
MAVADNPLASYQKASQLTQDAVVDRLVDAGVMAMSDNSKHRTCCMHPDCDRWDNPILIITADGRHIRCPTHALTWLLQAD